ncbi:MAG: YopX family protein [Coprococcus sp.]|jgi:uncharacterized phage protein (TIGR01671 family)
MMEDRYLFCAKRMDNGEWVEGFLFQLCYDSIFCWCIGNEPLSPNDYSELCGFNREWFYIDESTICQCTGLKDKNGKLIWENDIMVAHLDDSFPEDATYTRVVWNNNGFCTKEQGSEDIMYLNKFDQEHFEVCGNIFDNPELLEVEE